MKNLNKLGLILGVGGMSALVFSLAACGEDPPATTGGTGGTGGSTAGAGGNKAGAGGSAGSSSGSGGSSAGTGGMKATGGGGAGGTPAGGGGAGGAGGGGAGGASGSGGGGAGGGGGAPSAACKMLCEGAASIVTICAAQPIDADLKVTASCLVRCGKEADAAKVKCWQDHANNFKAMQGDHCKHAGGDAPCSDWPAP